MTLNWHAALPLSPSSYRGRLDILVEVWGGAEYEDDVVVGGQSNGTEFLRSVVVYSRVENQQDAEAG